MFLSHEYAPFRGGVATYVRELAAAAGRLHVPVEVWTVDYRGRFNQMPAAPAGVAATPVTESSAGLPVVRLPSNGRLTPGGLGRLAWALWRRRREWQPAPVLLLSAGAQMVFILLALIPGLIDARRVYPVFYGSEILRFSRSPFWRPLARRFYARAGGFGTTSRYVDTLLRASGLLPASAVLTLAPCALPAAFREEVCRRPLPPSLALDGAVAAETWRVLTVARLHPRKGQVAVVRALGRLPAEMRARLVYQVVGDGAAEYRAEIAAAGRAAAVRVEFLGALDAAALAAVYADATVYAQASLTLPRSVEGFGITFLEASSYGCPVAAYRSGGVGEAVRADETGLLVAEGNEAGLAEAIRCLLVDPALRARLGQRGREFALGLCWEDAASALCQMVQNPGGTGGPGSAGKA